MQTAPNFGSSNLVVFRTDALFKENLGHNNGRCVNTDEKISLKLGRINPDKPEISAKGQITLSISNSESGMSFSFLVCSTTSLSTETASCAISGTFLIAVVEHEQP
jgi:hypothetical protein